MFQLVPLADIKKALRVESADDDAILEIYSSAASLAVVGYLKGQAGELLSIDSPPNSPPNDLQTVDERVRTAVIGLTGVYYRNPDGDEAKNFETGYLPPFVTALLYPLRDPTLA